MLKADIDRDLKAAMLGGDKRLVSILRSIKSAILYKEVAEGKREGGLDEQLIVGVLKKERKTRIDASEMYHKANEQERGEEEDYQISVIEGYLPEELSVDVVKKVVYSVVAEMGLDTLGMKDMGKIIGASKKKEPRADGSMLSEIVKDIINKG